MTWNLKTGFSSFALLLLVSAASGRAMAATSCGDIAQTAIANGAILSATLVPAGTMVPPPDPHRRAGPNPADQLSVYKATPAFCRVQVSLHPSSDSDIRAEVWMPATGWNGRLEMIGNGAYSGGMMYDNLARGVTNGYAVAVSDTGHTQEHDDNFYVGHPEKVVDWETRAVHETNVAAKAIVAAQYGGEPKYSYWNSCSTGGRQGWMEAEYYPNDFDGLAIGDPANPMTRLQAGSIWANLAVNKSAGSFITPEKWLMIHQAVVASCDAKDGLKDGLVENPLACNFDARTLLCKAGDEANCLTKPQFEALEAITNGAKNPRTGEQIYPGYPLGDLLPGSIARKDPDDAAIETFRILFNDPNWDYHSFNFDADVARSDKLGYQKMNAVNPENLKNLFAHGGKILMYHGWDDAAITPLISIKLYKEAVEANGGLSNTFDKIRLFMVPAMPHCMVTFDQMKVITDWVEKGKAPNSIIETYKISPNKQNSTAVRALPLCPYPQVARYQGKGDVNEAASFSCKAPSSES